MEDYNLPSASDRRWADIVTGKMQPDWTVLALKIMMVRILSSTKRDPSGGNILKCAEEVRAFMQKNMRLVQPDLSKIFKS